VDENHASGATTELYNEVYRPQFHFSPKTNWTNDPNGLVYYKGEYHLFFQHNPFGLQWGNMTWGHAVSPDLVHWTQLDDALQPDRLGTMFSGSAVVDADNTAGFQSGGEKTIVAIYTAAGGTSKESEGQPFTQALAYSVDRGRTFKKYDKNPVLGHIAAENRDPKVVWHAPTKRWVMVLYIEGSDYALYASPDLKRWDHLQTFSIPGTSECPDFFEIPVDGDKKNTRWVAMSANGTCLIGGFDGQKFTSEGGPHLSDRGANFYAAQTYSDTPDGRRIQITWMNGGKYPDMQFNQQMSFPCELTLRTAKEGLRLFRNPVKEIEKLHGKAHHWKDLTLTPGVNPLSDLKGDLFDIQLELEPGDAKEIVLTLRGEVLRYDVAERKLSFLGRSGDLAPENGRVKLRVLLDRTSIEAFGDGGKLSMTSCFLPQPEDQSLSLSANGGSARIHSLTVYPLKSAWSHGKTHE
jgi:sucrose-6-phosphate hydrolase SacC (GH32 family)